MAKSPLVAVAAVKAARRAARLVAARLQDRHGALASAEKGALSLLEVTDTTGGEVSIADADAELLGAFHELREAVEAGDVAAAQLPPLPVGVADVVEHEAEAP